MVRVVVINRSYRGWAGNDGKFGYAVLKLHRIFSPMLVKSINMGEHEEDHRGVILTQ